MIDKRYFNKYGVILAISSVGILLTLLDSSAYDNLVENPADIASKTTSGMLAHIVIYYIHINLGKAGIYSIFIVLALLGIFIGFDWHRFFDKEK
jgi:hypothetical protein